MNKLLNNHFNLFITILVGTTIGLGIWYFTLFSGLQTENKNLSKKLRSQKAKSTKAEKTFSDLAKVKREWSDYNISFEEKISRIPDITEQKRIFNVKRWNKFSNGGHFAALEEPDILVNDIISFFNKDIKKL